MTNLEAYEKARALTKKISHYYSLARTNHEHRDWYCSEAKRLEPVLARLTYEALN